MTKAQQAIAILGIVTISSGTTMLLSPTKIEVIKETTQGQNITSGMSVENYNVLKAMLLGKKNRNEKFSIDEWNALVRIYDTEIKDKGGLTYNGIKSKKQIEENVIKDVEK